MPYFQPLLMQLTRSWSIFFGNLLPLLLLQNVPGFILLLCAIRKEI
ncbi:unnamed protein product [Protopolystoma xenopodis]|uniref:Uncharacterized protein n=1 Tax=Protopolystoma xenopodis TaxID=117903 RepID=A0A3S5AW40_9PLAT|nr:unnamed protein product [Protopolystoma xenopodis]